MTKTIEDLLDLPSSITLGFDDGMANIIPKSIFSCDSELEELTNFILSRINDGEQEELD